MSCSEVTHPVVKEADSPSLPLFVFVMTKMKASPVLPQLRLKTLSDNQPSRPIEEKGEAVKKRLIDWIKYLQISCILEQSRIT